MAFLIRVLERIVKNNFSKIIKQKKMSNATQLFHSIPSDDLIRDLRQALQAVNSVTLSAKKQELV